MLDRHLDRFGPRHWHGFVDLAAIVWVGLFLVQVAGIAGTVAIGSGTVRLIDRALTALLVVFVVDILLRYRWADQGPVAFVRGNWVWILAVVPLFRPLRFLRAGRGVRLLRSAGGLRRLGSLLRKLKRFGRRAWRRLVG